MAWFKIQSNERITHGSLTDGTTFYRNIRSLGVSSELNDAKIQFVKTTELPTSGTVDMSAEQDGSIVATYVPHDSITIWHTCDLLDCNEDCSGMFNNLIGGGGIFGLDKLRTDNVTNMSRMFGRIRWYSGTLNLNNFNTSNVTDMSYMFGAEDNSSLFHIDISNFDTSNVTTMEGMFKNQMWLVDGPDYGFDNSLIVKNFNTSKVKNFKSMFTDCLIENLDLSGFDFSQAYNQSFGYLYQLNFMYGSYPEALSRFHPIIPKKTGNLTNTSRFLYGANSSSYIDADNYNTYFIVSDT